MLILLWDPNDIERLPTWAVPHKTGLRTEGTMLAVQRSELHISLEYRKTLAVSELIDRTAYRLMLEVARNISLFAFLC